MAADGHSNMLMPNWNPPPVIWISLTTDQVAGDNRGGGLAVGGGVLNQVIDATKTLLNLCLQLHLSPLMFDAKLFTWCGSFPLKAKG